MMNYIKNILLATGVLFIIFVVSSCRTKKDITYFQPPEDTTAYAEFLLKNDSVLSKPYSPTIRHNDILGIYVSSINPEATSFFNPTFGTGANSTSNSISTNPSISGYLVDVEGEIELPLVGVVKVAGLTVPMIRDTLRTKLEKYLEHPTVRVVFLNFKVTVLGEVKVPGVYTVTNERVTLPEAIGLAGDLTIFGRRSNILIVREENNIKQFANINILDRSIFQSPFYFLHPNDVIYVQPVGAKVESSDNFFRWYSFVISNLTLLLFLLAYANK
ncbi:MAG: polysaccharide biosynthesis/export family protein [Bacteroidia bacterium]